MSKRPDTAGFSLDGVSPPKRASASRVINGYLKDPAHSVNPVWNAVPFPGHRAIGFPDTRRVRRCHIDLYHDIRIPPVQFGQRARDKFQCLPIVREIDAIQEVGAVSGIRNYRARSGAPV